jgi:Periplasmic binding protein-like domain
VSGRSRGVGTPPARYWPRTRYDATFCGSDQIAVGVLDAPAPVGRWVPDDVAVVWYDNWEVFAAKSRPLLTTIELNGEQFGDAAVRYLFAAIEGVPASGVVRHLGRLVVRQSTGPLPGPTAGVVIVGLGVRCAQAQTDDGAGSTRVPGPAGSVPGLGRR